MWVGKCFPRLMTSWSRGSSQSSHSQSMVDFEINVVTHENVGPFYYYKCLTNVANFKNVYCLILFYALRTQNVNSSLTWDSNFQFAILFLWFPFTKVILFETLSEIKYR